MKKTFSIVILVLAFVILAKNNVFATSYVITGNGSDTNNSLSAQNQSNTTVTQSNNANVTNDVNANSNSGGNTIDGSTGGQGQILTGASTSKVSVKNNLNKNSATVNNCCPTANPPGIPPSTPPGGSNGGNPGSSSNGGTGGGGVGGASAGSPQILGLSNTAGSENEKYLFYIVGTLCLGLGGALLRTPRKLK